MSSRAKKILSMAVNQPDVFGNRALIDFDLQNVQETSEDVFELTPFNPVNATLQNI